MVGKTKLKDGTIAFMTSKSKVILISRDNNKIFYYKGFITSPTAEKINLQEVCRVSKMLGDRWVVCDKEEFEKVKLKLVENEI